MAKALRVPDIGDFDAVEVIEVLVSAGDEIEAEQPLITLESDKATMEVPAEAAGTVAEVKVAEGDKVSEGDVIVILADDEGHREEKQEEASRQGEKAQPEEQREGAQEERKEKRKDGERLTVRVPDIGGFEAVEIIEVLVALGDEIDEEQPLITLESDKATMEVPSTAAGRVVELNVSEGDTVSEGDAIAVVETGQEEKQPPPKGADAPSAAQPKKAQEDSYEGTKTQDVSEEATGSAAEPAPAASEAPGLAPVDEEAFGKAHASPAVRKFARELGVDLARVEGSGRKARILKEDVQKHVKGIVQRADRPAAAPTAGLPQQPEVDFAKFGETETVALSRIRRLSAKAVHRSWLLIPHVTQFDAADITELEAFRQQQKGKAEAKGFKLTLLAFLLKASAVTLEEFPDLNSSLAADGEHLIRKHYCHIGVAVDTEQGLVVPVIRDVDEKGVFDLARELGEVSERARSGKLKREDLEGGCFSISSLGGVGGTAFTPIVNSPEVAILGVSKASRQPIWNGDEFEPRLMLPLSLSYDHRVIDGAEAARVTSFLADVLVDIRKLLL